MQVDFTPDSRNQVPCAFAAPSAPPGFCLVLCLLFVVPNAGFQGGGCCCKLQVGFGGGVWAFGFGPGFGEIFAWCLELELGA